MVDKNIKYLRKKKYLSHQIQGSLLGAMVALEVLLISLAMVYLYFSFNDILEQQMFSIHRVKQDQTFNLMFIELLKTVLVLSIINCLALLLAHVLWGKYVSYIISTFYNELILIEQLDLTGTYVNNNQSHEVVNLLYQWKQVELKRCEELHQLISTLHEQLDLPASDHKHKQIQQISLSIQQLLPI